MSFKNSRRSIRSHIVRRAVQKTGYTGLEMLESRRLLAGDVSGTVYHDVNGNGTWNGGEATLPNIRVYLDTNNNGEYNNGEPSTMTDGVGFYYIENVPLGMNYLRAEVPEDWQMTQPASGSYEINIVMIGMGYGSANFGLQEIGGTVRGTAVLYPDNSDDPIPAEEFSVYVDLDESGTPTNGDLLAEVNAQGQWHFDNLAPGTYQIRIDHGLDYVVGEPDTKVIEVTVVAGQDEGVGTFELYADDDTTSIIYVETTPGATMFIDANGNGLLDNGERSRTADGNGNASFTALPPDTYNLIVTLPADYIFATSEDGHFTVDLNNPLQNAVVDASAYGGPGTITGHLFIDTNGNGQRDAGEPGRAGEVYIDANDNGILDQGDTVAIAGSNGAYEFNHLNIAVYRIRENLGAGFASTMPNNGVNVGVGMAGSPGIDFGAQVQGPPPVLNDFNGDGKADILHRDPVTGRYSVWFMDGNTRVGSEQLHVAGPAWDIGGTGDFNGDGQTDIIWRNRIDGNQVIWEMDDSLGFFATYISGPAAKWELKGVGDINGDDKVDLIYRDTTSGAVTAWKMKGVQPYDVLHRYAALPLVSDLNWDIAAVADFDDDGHTDLMWVNNTTNQANIWLMNHKALKADGFRGFTRPADPAWKLLAVSDFDNDGTKDLLWDNGKAGSIWKLTGVDTRPLQIAFDNANLYNV